MFSLGLPVLVLSLKAICISSSSLNAHNYPLRSSEIRSKPVDLHSVLDSMKRSVLFFNGRFDKINMDGIFGVRAMEGELVDILNKYKEMKYPVLLHDDAAVAKMYKILDLTHQMTERLKQSNES